MVSKKDIAVVAASSSTGLAQTWILREYVDKTQGLIPGLEVLGGFGTYSAMGGIIAGGAATALGLVSILTGKVTRNEAIQLGLIGYGVPALSGGVLSGLFPAITIPGARLRAPATTIKLQSAGVPSGRVVSGRVVSGQAGAIPLRT